MNDETFVDKAYQNDFMKGMQKLRQDEEYTDVTLQSGGVQIRCHRNVLVVASDYFRAMFRCGLEECTSTTVQLTIQPEILTCIVDYMYTGEIELTVDNVESLFKTGDLLQLNNLKVACENFMLKHVEPANCVGFYKFAALYRLDKLQRKANRAINSEFKTVAFIDEFKNLSRIELIELIKDDDVNVEYEDVVFESVQDWVRYDIDNKKCHPLRRSLNTSVCHIVRAATCGTRRTHVIC